MVTRCSHTGIQKLSPLSKGFSKEGFSVPVMLNNAIPLHQARHVAMVIGQAFSVAYKEFLRANGISEDALEEAEYAHILNAQSAPQAEVDVLRDQRKTKKVST